MPNPLGMSFEPGADQARPTLTPAQQAIQILALRLPKRRAFGEAGAGISPLVGAEAGPPTGAASPSAVVQSILRTLLGPQATAGPVQAAAAAMAPARGPGPIRGPVQMPRGGQPSSYVQPGGIRPPVVIPGAPPQRPPVVIPGAAEPTVTAPSLAELPAPTRPTVNLDDLIGALINARRQPGRTA